MHQEHPVRLVVADDLRRNRLTVFFRWLLAAPHYVWLFLWSIGAAFAALVTWIAALLLGRPPAGLHRFLSKYIRYQLHLNAYLWLAAGPYPPFTGEEGAYPIDVVLPEPVRQSRWTILFRILLAIPALLVVGELAQTVRYGASVLVMCGFLGWFAGLALGRMPRGLRDAATYSLGYAAQTAAYLLLITDRYPQSDPRPMLAGVELPPLHPVRVVGDPHDLRRSRVTTFFRILLALPHIVWLTLWGALVTVATIANWIVLLATGSPAGPLHRFVSAWLRYRLHVYAFLYLVANPFPGFVGDPARYPLNLELPSLSRQSRWKTFFRVVLAVPALLLDGTLSGALLIAALLTWCHALVRGRATWGLRNLAAYAVRYDMQVYAYLLLVTDAYPHASPLEGAPMAQHELSEAAVAA